MNRILVVDDSLTITTVLSNRLKKFNFDIVVAASYSAATELVEEDCNFFLAILDLNLPDAANGEIVDYMLDKNIPSVVMTGNYHEEQRAFYSQKSIVDYVLKDSPWSLEYIVNLSKRIYDNQYITVLVVDDSISIRKTYRKLLETHNYNVIEAENGIYALQHLSRLGENIRLIVTDYNMPEMDGFELIPKVREMYSKEDISIIGLSAEADRTVSAKFLKLGANDFLSKSFIKEEFYARVSQNIESLELINTLKDIAMKDHLTGLFNRHYFFTAAERVLAAAKQNGNKLYVAMMDIDHFKSVNDTYGHQAGDMVLEAFSKRLQDIVAGILDKPVIARFGGEEFVVVYADQSDDCRFVEVLEELRKKTEETPEDCKGIKVSYTVSIGVSLSNDGKSLDDMVKTADESLYVAKENGRNRIVIN